MAADRAGEYGITVVGMRGAWRTAFGEPAHASEARRVAAGATAT